MTFTTVYLGLGGNIPSRYGSPEKTIASALNAVGKIRGVERGSFSVSRLYETEPVIVPGEPLSVHKSGNYVNAVCSFKTTLGVAELFSRLETIERNHDKYTYYSDKGKNDPRPIDIDVLFYGDFIGKINLSAGNQLQIPHAHWNNRLFVLIPLRDITTDITLRESPMAYISQIVNIQGMISARFPVRDVKCVMQMKNADLENLMSLMAVEKSGTRLSGGVPGSPEAQSKSLDFDKPRRNSGRNADEMNDESKSPVWTSSPPLTRAAAKRSNPPKVPDVIVEAIDKMEVC